MKKITGILIDAKKETAGVSTIECSLIGYYEALNCTMIDIVRRKIGAYRGRYYDIICDDEALLKPDPLITAIDCMGEAMLCGSLFICKHDGPEEKSLDQDDIDYILRFIRKGSTRRHPNEYPMLYHCEY